MTMKLAVFGVLSFLWCASASAQPANANNPKTWFFQAHGDLGFYPKLIKGIDKAPAIVRQVRAHPDDPINPGQLVVRPLPFYIPDPNIDNRVVTIPDDQVEVNGVAVFALDFMINRRSPGSKNEIAFGPTYDLPFGYGSKKANTGNTREYDYINGDTTRGSGSALAYYSAIIRPSWHLPGLHVQFKREISQSPLNKVFDRASAYRLTKIISGYRLTPYKLIFTNGLDRFDALDESNRYVGANNWLHQPYIGIETSKCDSWEGRCGYFNVAAGPVFQSTHPTELGETAEVHYTKTAWRISATTGYRW